MIKDIVNSALFPGTYSTYELSLPQCFLIADTIPILYVPYICDATALIIFAHGNGSDIGMLRENMYMLSTVAKVHVVVFDYPGYGKHEGRSTERTVDWTIRKVYDFVTSPTGMGWPPERTVLQGNCIGCGPCVRLAISKNVKVGGLILQGCMRNVKEAAANFIGGSRLRRSIIRLLVSSRWNVEKDLVKAGAKKIPVCWIHGELDNLFPLEETRVMHESYTGPKIMHMMKGGTHYSYNWKSDVCYATRKFVHHVYTDLHKSLDPVTRIPVLSTMEGKTFQEIAKFRKINLLPAPYREPSCVNYRKLFKQSNIRDAQMEEDWDEADALSHPGSEESVDLWDALAHSFGTQDAFYQHIRARMLRMCKALQEESVATPSLKDSTLQAIKLWTRKRYYSIGNPLGELNLGFNRANALIAVHYFGFLWFIQEGHTDVTFRRASLGFWKAPEFSEITWMPVVSTPMVHLDQLTEMVVFSLIDADATVSGKKGKFNHHCEVHRKALSRTWSWAALGYYHSGDVLLPQPKLLIRQNAIMGGGAWSPKESLWKLVRLMMGNLAQWNRLLCRIPTTLVPLEEWDIVNCQSPQVQTPLTRQCPSATSTSSVLSSKSQVINAQDLFHSSLDLSQGSSKPAFVGDIPSARNVEDPLTQTRPALFEPHTEDSTSVLADKEPAAEALKVLSVASTAESRGSATPLKRQKFSSSCASAAWIATANKVFFDFDQAGTENVDKACRALTSLASQCFGGTDESCEKVFPEIIGRIAASTRPTFQEVTVHHTPRNRDL